MYFTPSVILYIYLRTCESCIPSLCWKVFSLLNNERQEIENNLLNLPVICFSYKRNTETYGPDIEVFEPARNKRKLVRTNRSQKDEILVFHIVSIGVVPWSLKQYFCSRDFDIMRSYLCWIKTFMFRFRADNHTDVVVQLVARQSGNPRRWQSQIGNWLMKDKTEILTKGGTCCYISFFSSYAYELTGTHPTVRQLSFRPKM